MLTQTANGAIGKRVLISGGDYAGFEGLIDQITLHGNSGKVRVIVSPPTSVIYVDLDDLDLTPEGVAQP